MMHRRSGPIAIEFEDVTVAAGGTTILNQVNLTFAPGLPSVLIGPNGAGKTTLLRTAMGLAAPSSGRIRWAGEAAPAAIRRAIVFQHPAMLRRSVGGNIRYALRAAGTPRARRAADEAALLDQVGLLHLRSRPARRLSGGEQQRLALARALALDPEVLFLDEPTASLDPAGTKAIEEIVQDIARRGIKVILSTHDLGEAKRLAGEIILLHRGRVVETGAPAGFFASPKTAEAQKFVAGELLV